MKKKKNFKLSAFTKQILTEKQATEVKGGDPSASGGGGLVHDIIIWPT